MKISNATKVRGLLFFLIVRKKATNEKNQPKIDDYFTQKRNKEGKDEEETNKGKGEARRENPKRSTRMNDFKQGKNYLFYKSELQSSPSGDFIGIIFHNLS